MKEIERNKKKNAFVIIWVCNEQVVYNQTSLSLAGCDVNNAEHVCIHELSRLFTVKLTH